MWPKKKKQEKKQRIIVSIEKSSMTVRILNVFRDCVIWDFHHLTKQIQKKIISK